MVTKVPFIILICAFVPYASHSQVVNINTLVKWKTSIAKLNELTNYKCYIVFQDEDLCLTTVVFLSQDAQTHHSDDKEEINN